MNVKWLMLAPLPVWALMATFLVAAPAYFQANFPLFWILHDAGIIVAISGLLLWLFADHQAAPKPRRALFHRHRPRGH